MKKLIVFAVLALALSGCASYDGLKSPVDRNPPSCTESNIFQSMNNGLGSQCPKIDLSGPANPNYKK